MTLEHRLQQAYGHPDDATRARLDARVAASSFDAPEPVARGRGRRRRPVLGSVARGPAVAVAMSALIAIVLVAGNVRTGDGTRTAVNGDRGLVSPGQSTSGPTVGPEADRSSADTALGGEAAERGIAPSTPVTGKTGGARDTIESTTMRLRTDEKADFASATERIPAIATGLGGHVQSAQVSREGASGQASYQLVVPKAALGKALNQLSAVAEVEQQSSQLTDVTDQTTQASAEVKTLTERVSRLRQQVEDASATARPALVAQLADARAQLANARQQRDSLAQGVASTTISVTLSLTDEPVAVDEPRSDDPWSPATALDAVGEAWTWMGGVLVLVALVGAPVWLLLGYRWLRRRRP